MVCGCATRERGDAIFLSAPTEMTINRSARISLATLAAIAVAAVTDIDLRDGHRLRAIARLRTRLGIRGGGPSTSRRVTQ